MAGSARIAKPRNKVAADRAPGVYPQPGFQLAALSTSADIAIIGGGAGGGKTYTLLMEGSRHQYNPDFGAVIFRRTYPQIVSEGGLWDTAKALYPLVGAVPRENQMDWKFPSGAAVSFRHLQYERNVLDWQGSQVPLLIFDELTHFTKYQFWYMLSRNRSTCGVRPYVRASCNPDPDSWVAELIGWYIGEDGFPIPARAGVLRWFTRDGETMVWGDTPEEVIAKAPHLFAGALAGVRPKSFTFIPGSIYENKKLLDVNPEYLGNLMAQDPETRAQLLEGNWKVKVDGLALFEHQRLYDLFSNHLAVEREPLRCITCDPAGFGRDMCVIMVWVGYECVAGAVLRKSDNQLVHAGIELLRKAWRVAASDTLVDQDGLGGGVVKLGGYAGFSGGAQALAEPETGIREAYKNLKTQCFYRYAQLVNSALTTFTVTTDNWTIDGKRGTKLMLGGKEVDIRDLIRADLKAIKRAKADAEGKKHINTKEEQKILLGGRSPDFGDCASQRAWFDVRPRPAKPWFLKRVN
ncbi:terminase large subunit domain-containing protein [Hymenobacter nivis]|uniref:Uncharacterized protein n=1 Tax=Hymenobacter nivis TaxID=1850093 RepID=A0A502GXY6_9BACT|nr:terminase family protein [Hymenobacter nivis]TPG66080.1 hypothetical protein EAH73_11970 [Hymenobacter nivis]